MDWTAVISNCGDVHTVSRLKYIEDLIASTPELKHEYWGSCSPNGRYSGQKMVCIRLMVVCLLTILARGRTSEVSM